MQLDILNAQTGHTVLQFDSSNAEEVERARLQIETMMRAGFAIFAEIGGKKTVRVTKFDAKNGKYLIGDKEVTKLTASPPSAGGCLKK
jgi:hypothetical protein